MSQIRIELAVPDEAEPSELINCYVSIWNETNNPEPHNIDWACPRILVDDEVIFVGDERHIPPLEYDDNLEVWNFQYTMPDKSVLMVAEGYFESGYYEWHLDTSTSKHIYLPGEGGGLPWLLLALTGGVAAFAMVRAKKAG